MWWVLSEILNIWGILGGICFLCFSSFLKQNVHQVQGRKKNRICFNCWLTKWIVCVGRIWLWQSFTRTTKKKRTIKPIERYVLSGHWKETDRAGQSEIEHKRHQFCWLPTKRTVFPMPIAIPSKPKNVTK